MQLNEFQVLTYIEKNNNIKMTQRDISNNINLSLGTVNKVLNDLDNKKLIKSDNQIISVTEKGYKELEPYRVKRAIFLAAGFGSRMVPITLNTPKPLVLVHGKRIIETLLDAIVEAGIEEIIIVRGYLSEQFDVLLKKYPNIKFIENTVYNEANNISSAYLVRNYISNSYILESDLLLYNKDIITKYQYSSNYIGKYVSKTDDWCFETKKGLITKLKVGGIDCYHMYGIAYFNKEAGEKYIKDVEYVFNELPGGKEKYWDQVHLDALKENYQFYVREIKEGDVIEIDTFNELKKIDKIYDV